MRARFIILCTLLLTGCDQTDYLVTSLGTPTPLDGRTPVEAICEIQREFTELPKPLLKDIVHHPETSRRMQVDFHVSKEALPGYYQYQLTDDASHWLKQHTQAELSAALMPLVLDDDMGAEAAVLIASLASNRTFRTASYGYHNSSIASGVTNFLFETGYRSPSEPGSWDLDTAHQFTVPQQVRTSFLTPEEQDLYSYENHDGLVTLNAYLNRIQFDLTYYENGMSHNYEDGTFIKTETLAEWIVQNPLPSIPDIERHQKMLQDYELPIIVFAAYTGYLKTGFAVYELGIKDYWPLNYNQSHTVKELNGRLNKHHEYREAYFREVRHAVFAFTQQTCADKLVNR